MRPNPFGAHDDPDRTLSAAPCIPIPRCGGRIYRVRRNVPVARMDRELHLSIGFSSLAMFAPGQRSRGGCFLKRRETPVSVYMRLPQDKTPAAEVRRAGFEDRGRSGVESSRTAPLLKTALAEWTRQLHTLAPCPACPRRSRSAASRYCLGPRRDWTADLDHEASRSGRPGAGAVRAREVRVRTPAKPS